MKCLECNSRPADFKPRRFRIIDPSVLDQFPTRDENNIVKARRLFCSDECEKKYCAMMVQLNPKEVSAFEELDPI